MSHNDLLSLLDNTPENNGTSGNYAYTHPTVDVTFHTALNLDAWDVEQGAKCIDEATHLNTSGGLGELELADFFGAAFKADPELNESCIDPRRHDYVKGLLESGDFQALRESTVLNTMASTMTAVHLGTEFVKLQNQDRKEKPSGNPDRDQTKREARTAAAIGKAVANAEKDVEELKDMQRALGCGDGQNDGTQVNLNEVRETFRRVRNNPTLRRIMELAGRYRMVAQSKQRNKVRHGYDDMVGVTQDNDVSRLLPHELAQINDEDLELLTLKRFVERQTMCREYRGEEKAGKGPIIVCVDESGSMSGEPVAQAKAFALAMAWIARHQKRFCALVGYAGGTKGTLCVLPPGKWDQKAVLSWLEHFFSGGTVLDVPLRELPNDYWPRIGAPKGKTDLIILTDGIVNLDPKMRNDFNAWKLREKVRCTTLILRAEPGPMSEVSEEVHRVDSLSVGENAIQKCMSV